MPLLGEAEALGVSKRLPPMAHSQVAGRVDLEAGSPIPAGTGPSRVFVSVNPMAPRRRIPEVVLHHGEILQSIDDWIAFHL